MAFSNSGTSSSQSSEINVTPLIDVLLVLLIIFMVIVPVTPHGLDSSIPQGKGSEAAALPPVVVRLVNPGAQRPMQYRVGLDDLSFDALQARLKSMFAVREDRTLFVEADRSLSFQQVAVVVGEGRAAGAGAVVLQGAGKP